MLPSNLYKMSGPIDPVKTTVYVTNLSFSLTNSDIHTIFGKYGRISRVTIMKNKQHKSRGVAFIQFYEENHANACLELNNTQMFGRTLKISIAKDNGRSLEFSKKRAYTDNERCFECGEDGHVSYYCPLNVLGTRETPKKTEQKNKHLKSTVSNEDSVRFSANEFRSLDDSKSTGCDDISTVGRKRYRQSTYLSDDEEELSG